MEKQIIEILKTKKGYIFENHEDDYLFELIRDTMEATLEVYQEEQIKKLPFPGQTTEQKVCFSLLRMRNFFQAISHDRDFVLSYRKKIVENDNLLKAMKESFPKINFFIKVITEDLQSNPSVKPELLEQNQELTYHILDHYEQLSNKLK